MHPRATTGPGGSGLPEGFLFGVATAGFQVEGGFNGPGEPANNWLAWEQVGKVQPSGNAVGFFDRPEEALDRAAALGCDSFRLGVEWARVVLEEDRVDRDALARYVRIVEACAERGLVPLVTVHHFTHPDWLGADFWLRPDAPDRFRRWTELVVDAMAPTVRHWVTINEINVLLIYSWLLGAFPPGRWLAFGDAAIAADNLLTAHVLAYEVIHRSRADAIVTTNNACLSIYGHDRMLTDLLLCRSAGVERVELDAWLAERGREHDQLVPAPDLAELLLRRAGVLTGAYGGRGIRRPGRRRPPLPMRAVDAVYASPHERTLDVAAIDYYDPNAARHFRIPGHRTAGGRNWLPSRELWDDVSDPSGLTRWLRNQHSFAPGLPLWVVENGLCNRVRHGRSYPRLDGWDRPRYLRENIAAVIAAVDEGVPVTGYWHWSLMDNYEWGSYEPRFGLFGIDRHRGEHGTNWLETDALGDDSAGAYRRIIDGVRAGDRSVLQ
jgi:beta-glucosidase